MDPNVKARYEARAKIVKAMAHSTRLFIVDEISKGERCVCELTEMVGDDVSTISKHLSILKGAGIVADEKRGQKVFYRLLVPWVSSCTDCLSSIARARNSA